jgi:hypothetical protein
VQYFHVLYPLKKSFFFSCSIVVKVFLSSVCPLYKCSYVSSKWCCNTNCVFSIEHCSSCVTFSNSDDTSLSVPSSYLSPISSSGSYVTLSFFFMLYPFIRESALAGRIQCSDTTVRFPSGSSWKPLKFCFFGCVILSNSLQVCLH